MKITGIITENLLFHEGFLKQIEKVRKIAECDVLVAVMPGYFTQRGEPITTDKWQRVEDLIEVGADLIIELPFANTVQGIRQYAEASVQMLSLAGVDQIAFASETNHLAELAQLSLMSFNVDAIKEQNDLGTAYPKSYGLSAGAYYPGDILGIAYLRAMQGKDILPLTFQHIDNKGADDPVNWSIYYPFLRWKLLTQDHDSLSQLFLFDEGIEHHLLKHAAQCDDWESFMKECVTRRYTQARIQRICAHLMVHTLKSEIAKIKEPTTLRILGFNDIGRAYLKTLKKNDVRVASRFNQLPRYLRELEYRSTLAYVTPFSVDRRNALIDREMGGPVIKTRKL